MLGLKERLKKVAGKGERPQEQVKEELAEIRLVLEELTIYVHDHPFEVETEQVDYYKNIYPQFRCLHIYHYEQHKLEDSLPGGDRQLQAAAYRERMQAVLKELQREAFHHRYFKLAADELDGLFFTFCGQESVLLPVIGEAECSQCPVVSYLFARFRALELLFHYCKMRLEELEPPMVSGKPRGRVKWTGSVINLIEIAHGIYLTDQVNGGEIGIVEFFAALSDFFGVDMGIPKNGLRDLNARKMFSKTVFTEEVLDKLRTRLDEEHDLKKERMKREGHRW
jgi:hypothetical protein